MKKDVSEGWDSPGLLTTQANCSQKQEKNTKVIEAEYEIILYKIVQQ